MASNSILTLGSYKNRKLISKKTILDTYKILGYIASGTYGKVYKAEYRSGSFNNNKTTTINSNANSNANSNTNHKNNHDLKKLLFAIKKFKGDSRDGEILHYTGLSQSACREIALSKELKHENIIQLVEIVLEKKSIYIVFEFAEHDLLQIIHFHSQNGLKPIPEFSFKSIMWQILNGVSYLHQNWIFHRDLKPANIMVTYDGIIKIGDLGLARKFDNPLQNFYTGDKVVVTIWYRAPELLLGGRHYTPAIDLWAVGCILAELLALRPIFKGEEAKIENRRTIPFQTNQMFKIIEILGKPTVKNWPTLDKYPEYQHLQNFKAYSNKLLTWFHNIGQSNSNLFSLLQTLLEYDPAERIAAYDALVHQYFLEPPYVSTNAFDGLPFKYPRRKITTDTTDLLQLQNKNYKRNPNDLDAISSRKRQKV
ncbi:cyclin-dependent serine/threonine protein kinase SSN3 [Ascoidea rubescens DSM 1968]|uniref:Cyclin-dependent kinase 8 n=1 Tax=Ascoidea rubescens DSM 1968 TaxID=1344418 RepID=A0A1D2VM87_9ASCO|nr:cyclin-dependent protein kinase [Ascoidea rubescens DSM 1968]ODV62721.1 cyclin-dependent protein kinase [Ascoidea rubescens DSM 1968]